MKYIYVSATPLALIVRHQSKHQRLIEALARLRINWLWETLVGYFTEGQWIQHIE